VPTAEVVRACLEEGLLLPGERVVVAASGGADSTALASLLAEARGHGLPLEIVLAHVDHGWRGEAEARADRAVVEALARRIGAPVEWVGPPPPGPRTEDAARRHRYSALDEVARRVGARKVATGHHLRDQAETFLLRLLRDSGATGLAGIPARRPLGERGVEVVRPLLRVEPSRLRAHLVERGIAWREDPTNADLSRDRNAVRARLLAVAARDGAASRRLAELAERLRRRVEARETALEDLLGDAVEIDDYREAVQVRRALLADLPGPMLDVALRRLGTRLGAERDGPWFTRRHLEVVRRLLAEEGSVDLPRGLRFSVRGGRAVLARR
jgi:tRNA(Ile)-lysidine synthase